MLFSLSSLAILTTNHSLKDETKNIKFREKSVFTSFKGSMSLEASLVVPIFLFFLMSILLSIEMVRLQTNVFEAIHQSVSVAFENNSTNSSKQIISTYLSKKQYPYICLKNKEKGLSIKDYSTIDSNGIINIEALYTEKIFISYLPIQNLEKEEVLIGHAFSGYVPIFENINSNTEDEYVYVTRTGSKYHRNRDCTYIKVKTSAVNAESISTLRNINGEKYYQCEICRPKLKNTLFITVYGNRYHSDLTCTAIKKDIRIIGLKEAISDGYTPCSKCG